MKKFVPIFLAIVGGVMFVSAQNFSGCVMGEVGGVPGCVCLNTVTQQVTLVAGSYCAGGVGMPGNGGPLLSFLALLQTIINRLVPFLIGLGVIVFFWYLIKFIIKGNENPTEKQEGLRGMGYSILAIFVMVSLWGIISLIGTVTGVGQGGGLPPIQLPQAL